jgi:hypothetical protein
LLDKTARPKCCFMKITGSFFVVLLGISLALTLRPGMAQDEALGVVSRAVAVTLDGNEVGSLRVGQTVSVLGENDETKEFLISFEDAAGHPVVGMIPQGSVIIAGGGRAATSPSAVGTVPTAPPPAEELDFSKPITAEQLGEFLQRNRNDFDRYRNQKLVVTGVVADASVTGRGTSQQVSVGFRMPSNLPKIKATMSPTYLGGEDFRKRFNFGQDYFYSTGQSVNFRSNRDGVQAQVVWERTHTYTYSGNRQYQSKSKSESAWIPILPVGSVATLQGVLSDFRFEVQIIDAEFQD